MKNVNKVNKLNENVPKRRFKSRARVGERPVKISDIRKMKVVS